MESPEEAVLCRSMSGDQPLDPMTPSRITVVCRRDVLLGGSAATLLATLVKPMSAAAGTSGNETASQPEAIAPAVPQGRIPVSAGLSHSPQFENALKTILVDAEPLMGEPLTLEMPELAENGNVVPYSLAVTNPMTDNDYVHTLHLLSTANPQAVVAKFQLVPATGKASVSGRMRLAKTQDVVAIAEISTGQLVVAVRKVEVTIGGCGTE